MFARAGRFALAIIVSLVPHTAIHASSSSATKTTRPREGVVRPKLETYKDLIEKARNLTLQRDRLQASQVLVRGLRKEPKTSFEFKELAKALDELSGLFYTEKGQTLFSLAETNVESKPREAIENYQAALRVEDGNVSILKALARVHLLLSECETAATVVAQAELLNPVSPEIRLLKLQAADCAGRADLVTELLSMADVPLGTVERHFRGIQIRDWLRRKDTKKARAALTSWETTQPDYPEVHYWKWKLSEGSAAARTSAQAYLRLCRNLSPRAKKNYSLDVELCKQKEAVEEHLRGLRDE